MVEAEGAVDLPGAGWEQVGSRLEEARLTSGAVLALAVTLVGWSSLRTPMFVLPIQSARSLPLWSSESSVDQS